MALFVLGSPFLQAPWLYQEKRFHPGLSRFGPFATPVAGVAFGRLTGAFGWVKRHFTGITIASASSLAVFGVILALDRLVWVTTQLQVALDNVGLDILVELG